MANIKSIYGNPVVDDNLRQSVATEYSSSSTYAVGDMVLKEGQLYKCNTAISTAEAWTAAHWTAVTVGGELATVKDGLTAVESDVTDLKEDLDDVETALETKAEIDGYYEEMTVGNAEQLVSTVYEKDSVPYIFRTAGGSMDIGDREEDMLVGGSVVWNQLAKALVDGNYNKGSGTAVYDNGTVSFTAGSRYGTLYCTTVKELVEYHKYLISANIKMTSQPSTNTVRLGVGDMGYNQGTIYVPSTASVTSFTEISGVVQYSYGTSPTNNYLFLQDKRAEVSQIDMKDLMLIDLTQMFGSTIADYIYSLEQATAGAGVAWFRKLFPKDYYAYDAGSLQSVQTSEHKMVGFNAWDEEWEVGAYNSSSGEKTDIVTDRIRSKNFIPVLPSTTYYNNKGFQVYWYDADHNFIGWNVKTNPGTFTTPSNCHYMTFNGLGNSGTTYNNDICINLSWSGWRNGEYEPYQKHSYPLDDSLTLRGIPKLDSNNKLYYDGDTYAPDGTVVRNTILRAYQSGDESLANAITDGTNTVVYSANASTETAEPYQHIQICDDFGTEEYVSTSIVPVGHNTRYPANLRDKLQHLPDIADDDGYYMIGQSNKHMHLELFRIPKAPTTDGAYTLKATVSGGTPTYTWEAQT